MGIIKINAIKLYAYHGCLKEESKIGSQYNVNITVKGNLQKSSKTDKLSDTIDYVCLNDIVRQEMAIPSKLLEHVTRRILKRILNEIPTVKKVWVSVAKINPPINGNIEEVVVRLSKKRKRQE